MKQLRKRRVIEDQKRNRQIDASQRDAGRQGMAKKLTKKQSEALGWLILIAIPIIAVIKVLEAIGAGGIAIIIGLIAAGYFWHLHSKKQAELRRRAALMGKYGDEEIVDRIMKRSVWTGQTTEQLNDSLGAPIDTDEKVFKTKRKEVWKYHQTGRNRFGLRITLEDGLVVGWDEKM